MANYNLSNFEEFQDRRTQLVKKELQNTRYRLRQIY